MIDSLFIPNIYCYIIYFFTAALLYIKAEVKNAFSRLNNYYAIIINKILRVPYPSDVYLHCEGPGIVSWQYRHHKLGKLSSTVANLETLNWDNVAYIGIRGFDKTDTGFYTCLSVDEDNVIEETVLVTDCKFYLIY